MKEKLLSSLDLTNYTKDINKIVDEIIKANPDLKTNAILAQIKCYSDELPRYIREYIYEYKLKSKIKVLVFNLSLEQYSFGSTPTKIAESFEKETISKIEILHCLISSVLGEIFTWSSIQNGNIINEVFPIKENMDKPISSGSNNVFDLHTEDAFHPFMGEYLSLFCLKNFNNAATILSSFDISEMSEKVIDILFEKRFLIGPNIAHNVNTQNEKFSILFGNRKFPFLRINLNNIKVLKNDDDARNALDTITRVLQENIIKYPMKSGDLMFIDNFRTVHGRDIYYPKYDGTDRWLKRLYITNDLKKSSEFKSTIDSRIINVR